MIDSNFFVNNMLVPFSAALAGGVGADIVKPVFHVLDNWFYLTFGSKSDFKVSKEKLLQQNQLDIYQFELEKVYNIGTLKKEIIDELNTIEESNLVVPDKHILAKVMSNISIYLDVDETRRIFSKIIAASCDVSRKKTLHPADVDLLERLTASDINLLRTLYLSLGFALEVVPKEYAEFENSADPCPIGIKDEELEKHFIFTSAEGEEKPNFAEGNYHVDMDRVVDSKHSPENSIKLLQRMGLVSSIDFNDFYQPLLVDIPEFVNSVSQKILETDEALAYKQLLEDGFGTCYLSVTTKIIQLTELGEHVCKIIFSDVQVPFVMTSDFDDFEIGIEMVRGE